MKNRHLILCLLGTTALLSGCPLDSSSNSDSTNNAPDVTTNPPPTDVTDEVVPATVQFLAMGDSGSGAPGQFAVGKAMAQVCQHKEASAGPCSFVLGFGDNIYEDGVDSVNDVQFDDKFEIPFAPVDLPFYMVLGNHDTTFFIGGDGGDNKRGDLQVDYHYREDRLTDRWHMPARYYQQSFGETADGSPLIEVMGLDSNPITSTLADSNPDYAWHRYGLEQLNWAQSAFISSRATWKVGMAHHPYVSNGFHGNAGNYDFIPSYLLPVASGERWKEFLEEAVCDYADFFMTGHDHDLQALEPQESCGRTEFIVSGAAGKTRSITSPQRNLSRFQQGDEYGFFWMQAKEGDAAAGVPPQMCMEAYVVLPDEEGLGIIADGQLTPAWTHCYDKQPQQNIARGKDFSGVTFISNQSLDLGRTPGDFARDFAGPLFEFRQQLLGGLNTLLSFAPESPADPAIAELITGIDTLMLGMDAAFSSITEAGDQEAAAQALMAVQAAAARLQDIDTSTFPAPFDRMGEAFNALSESTRALGEPTGEAQDIAFLMAPLVQLSFNMESILDDIHHQADETPLLSGLTKILSTVARGTSQTLEQLAVLSLSGSGEVLAGTIDRTLLAVTEDVLMLDLAPGPLGDNATLPGEALSRVLLEVARELTAHGDNIAVPLLQQFLNLLSPLLNPLEGLLLSFSDNPENG